MHILFLSSTCSKPMYDEIYNRRTRPMLDSSQKFFDTILRGFATQKNVVVDSASELPISHSCDKRLIFRQSRETVGGIRYTYIGFINFPILKTLTSFFAFRRFLKSYIKEYGNEEIKVVCDPLLLEASLACIKLCKKSGIEVSCIITDLPIFSKFNGETAIKRMLYKAYNSLSQNILKKFDKYVFLTEEMNTIVNKEGKPYIVMECIQNPDNEAFVLQKKSKPPIVLYAGKLHKEFGLDLLADAVDMIKSDCEIHIYGDGNYKEILKERSKKNSKLFVHGVVPLEEILKIEAQSTVLINPRTSQGEFTKFSFPSKTVEYMSMGVPVVMFRLSGIPDEYNRYLFYADEETPVALAATVDNVLAMSENEREAFGQAAKKFVDENKNYISQTKRLKEFLKQ